MAVLVAAGSVTLAISSAPLAGETITMRVIAGLAIIGAVMLWIRSHYSLYVWSAFLVVLAVGIILVVDFSHRSTVFWVAHAITACGLFWLAFLVLKLGMRLAGESS